MRSERAGLYLHVPFCSAICPYCDFAVTVGVEEQGASFVEGIVGEIELVDPSGWSFETLYFGGGTPSALSPGQLHTILGAVRGRFEVDTCAELSMEVNPEDVDAASCRDWRELGVTRLSLGVQSFDDHALRFLGRRHSARQGREAAAIALAAGFDCVSLDVIFGYPAELEECEERLADTLESAVELAPQHLSFYQLTIHGGTPFGRRRDRGRLAERDPERQAVSYELVHRRLAAAGFEAYEVSNFAIEPRFRSRHNQKYWRHIPYLGLGPSAHSFAGTRRWCNEPDVDRWRQAIARGEPPIASSEMLDREALALEALMLGLRTAAGIDLEQFATRFDLDLLGANEALVDRLVDAGRLVLDGARLRPTTRGMAVADGLAAAFSLGEAVDKARLSPRSAD